MSIYVTSDDSLYQERIVNAVCQLGAKRLVNTSQVKNDDTIIVQGTTLPENIVGLRTHIQSLTLIAWLPTYEGTTNNQEQLLDFCKQCAGIVAPTEAFKEWLITKGVTSNRITTCPLVGGSTSNDRPTFSKQIHQQLPVNSPRSIAIAKLNQAGGWGEITENSSLTAPVEIIDFISAGVPLLVNKWTKLANLIDHYHIGLCYADEQDKQGILAKVTTEQYQQLATNVNRLSKMLSSNYFIQQAFNQARYQASISSIDVTKQHPRFNIRVLDSQETLDYIERYRPSVARLGDGEISLMLGASQVFQDTDPLLEKRLREIVETPSSSHLLVCLSDTFHDIGRLVPKAQKWWTGHQQTFASFYEKLGEQGNVYGNTMVTRPYIDMQDRNQAGEIFHRIKKWWQDRDLLIVEGAYTRSGVGNDLYDNARSVQRIICPPKNAWEKYQEIEAAIKKYGQGKLVLVMLGMTATVIAADLADWGQVIDSGHLDPEYEWYRHGTITRVPIQGKHTAEMNYDNGVPKLIDDPQYNSEIILNLNNAD
jgi:glycosyltransferase family protein